MNYIIHPAPDLTPQIQTCLLAAPPCAPDCEDCADRLNPDYLTADIEEELAGFFEKQEQAAAKMRNWQTEIYRAEYEKIVAEQEFKSLKAMEDLILYGHCEIVVDPAVGESESVLTFQQLTEAYHELLEGAVPPLMIDGVPYYVIDSTAAKS